MDRFQYIKYHSHQFEQFFPIVYDRTRYWLIIKIFCQKTSHFHEKSLFSVTLAPWWQSNTLKILKIFSILLKPISKGNFILRLDGTIPIFIFWHRHSQHPTVQSYGSCEPLYQQRICQCWLYLRWMGHLASSEGTVYPLHWTSLPVRLLLRYQTTHQGHS